MYMNKFPQLAEMILCIRFYGLHDMYLCFGHKSFTGNIMASISPKIVQFYSGFINIVLCSVNFRLYLNSTMPVRHVVGPLKINCVEWRLAGVCTHRTDTRQF